MTTIPSSWAEMEERLAVQFGGAPCSFAEAREWVRQALQKKYGVQDASEIPRVKRAVALQKLAGVTVAVEEAGGFELTLNTRRDVAAIFARYFDGLVLDGPPWMLDPTDEGLPSFDERQAECGF